MLQRGYALSGMIEFQTNKPLLAQRLCKICTVDVGSTDVGRCKSGLTKPNRAQPDLRGPRSQRQVLAHFAEILRFRKWLLSWSMHDPSKTALVLNVVCGSIKRGRLRLFQKRAFLVGSLYMDDP